MKHLLSLILISISIWSCESPKEDIDNSEPVRIPWPDDTEAVGSDNVLPPLILKAQLSREVEDLTVFFGLISMGPSFLVKSHL